MSKDNLPATQVSGVLTPTMNAKEAAGLCAKIRAKAADLAELIRKLRDGAGWIPLGYATWEACCKEEFGYSRRHANRLIQSQKVIEQVGPVGPASPNERQARELARLPEDERADCWADYSEECEASEEKPTAAGLREKVNVWRADNEPFEPSCDDAEEPEDDEPVYVDDDDEVEQDDDAQKPTDQDDARDPLAEVWKLERQVLSILPSKAHEVACWEAYKEHHRGGHEPRFCGTPTIKDLHAFVTEWRSLLLEQVHPHEAGKDFWAEYHSIYAHLLHYLTGAWKPDCKIEVAVEQFVTTEVAKAFYHGRAKERPHDECNLLSVGRSAAVRHVLNRLAKRKWIESRDAADGGREYRIRPSFRQVALRIPDWRAVAIQKLGEALELLNGLDSSAERLIEEVLILLESNH